MEFIDTALDELAADAVPRLLPTRPQAQVAFDAVAVAAVLELFAAAAGTGGHCGRVARPRLCGMVSVHAQTCPPKAVGMAPSNQAVTKH